MSQSEPGLPRPGTTNSNDDPPTSNANLSCNLEEFEANGATLSDSQLGVNQSVLAQGLHQDVGKRGKPQPQLITLKLLSGGAVTEQIELMLLDAVFHLASGTVVVGMEFACAESLSGEGGDDKVTPRTLGIVGEASTPPVEGNSRSLWSETLFVKYG